MRRREFITLLGAVAVEWPLARTPSGRQMRRIGVLLGSWSASDPRGQILLRAFLEGLQKFGWTDGRNVRIDVRWAAGNADNMRKYAEELTALVPEAIFAPSGSSAGALLQASRAVPIVFAAVTDPVASGFVDSLSRPGGNATGFILHENTLSGKWLELLKQIAPDVTRAAIFSDPAAAAGIGQLAVIQSVAPSLGLDVSPINVRDAGEIERDVAAFERSSNGKGGLIVPGSPLALVHRDLIVTLAVRHKMPAVYFTRRFVADGGLISYGSDPIDQYRLAAGYVDRILKGEKPAELPVQAPTKYELVINLRTAKAIGFTVPPALLARADEVLE